jgi:hypothetical protein
VLFDETGQGGGSRYSVYLYDADKKSSVRLGDGRAIDLSSDGNWALTQSASEPQKLFLVSVADRTAKLVNNPGLAYRWVRFFPGHCNDILFAGGAPNEKEQLYRQEAPGGTPALIPGSLRIRSVVIDDERRFAVGVTGGSRLAVLDLIRGGSRLIDNNRHVRPVAFAGAGQVLTRREEGGAVMLELLSLTTGQLRPYHKIVSSDGSGTIETLSMFVAKDLKSYTYSRLQTLSTLFLVSGWT